MQSFGEDLLVAARQLYVYTEVVLARHTVSIGEIHDIRVRRATEASNAVRSTLRILKGHFPPSLRPSLEHVDNLANYMHQSFNAALDYKRPYSSYNPFGLCVDVAQFNQRLVKETFEPLVIDAFRMATMGMLLVHHFVLEFTMFMCSVADDFCETPMLSREYKESFSSIMRELLAYMTMNTEEVRMMFEFIQEHYAAAAAAPGGLRPDGPYSDMLEHLKHHSSHDKIDHFIDFNVKELDYLAVIKDKGRERDAMKNVRKLYFSFIVRSLQLYNNQEDDDLIKITQSVLMHDLKMFSNSMFTPQYRIFEDDNRRSSLLHSFMGETKHPVYHYASQPWATTRGTHGDRVITQVAGRVEVVPRSQVFIWRKRTQWTARHWLHAALTHGELSLCLDLMYNMVPFIRSNMHYRHTSSVDIEMVHMMMTRAFGIADTVALLERFHTETFAENLESTRDHLEKIPDPHVPAAVAIQPMPKAIKEWMKHMCRTFATDEQHKAHVHYAPTHAKFHRPTSINANDVLRPSNIDPHSYNVLWRRQLLEYGNWQSEPALAINSIFMLNYWEALVRIPTTVEQRTYSSTSLVIDNAAHYGERSTDTDLETYVDFPLEYESSRDYQWKLMSTMKEFKEKFKTKPHPFLHPKSWLWDLGTHKEHCWHKCDAATDVHGGTLLIMRDDEGIDDRRGDHTDEYIGDIIREDPSASECEDGDSEGSGSEDGGGFVDGGEDGGGFVDGGGGDGVGLVDGGGAPPGDGGAARALHAEAAEARIRTRGLRGAPVARVQHAPRARLAGAGNKSSTKQSKTSSSRRSKPTSATAQPAVGGTGTRRLTAAAQKAKDDAVAAAAAAVAHEASEAAAAAGGPAAATAGST